MSESSIKDMTVDEFLKYFEMQVETEKPQVVIFDNITTSKFYNDQRVETQNRVIQDLKEILKAHGISMIVIAHFNGNDPHRLFTSKDVRGSKTFPNIAEYWYNLHRLRLDSQDKEQGQDIAILHVEKSRSHKNSDTAYQLFFDDAMGGFVRDKKVSWGVAKDLFEKQVKIGGKR